MDENAVYVSSDVLNSGYADSPAAAAVFFAAVFFTAFFVEGLVGFALGFDAVALWALFNIARFRFASAILLLPSGLIPPFFVVEGPELANEELPRIVPSPVTSRKAVIARVIASLCCSSSEMIRSTSVKDSPSRS